MLPQRSGAETASRQPAALATSIDERVPRAPSRDRSGGASRVADVREGGVWSPAQHVKNTILYGLARALLAVLGPLPRGVLVTLGRALGRLVGALAYPLRRVALTNVRRVHPQLEPREARALVARTFDTLGAHLGDTVDLYGKKDLSVTFPLAEGARAVLDEALRGGRGVVFASAHLGPWERVAASLVSAGVPLVTLAREAYDPRLTRVLVRLRERHGVRAIFRGSKGASSRIVRTLRKNEVLGAPMDLASRVPSTQVPFLGVLAETPIGPARIALRTGAAVVVGTFAANGTVVMSRIAAHDLRVGLEGERELLHRINAELSARIMAAPHHWPWMHDRFRRQNSEPEGESS